MISCLRLFWHLMRLAASRTFWTAGSSSPTRMAMMAITTSNSISVNALRRTGREPDAKRCMMGNLPEHALTYLKPNEWKQHALGCHLSLPGHQEETSPRRWQRDCGKRYDWGQNREE